VGFIKKPRPTLTLHDYIHVRISSSYTICRGLAASTFFSLRRHRRRHRSAHTCCLCSLFVRHTSRVECVNDVVHEFHQFISTEPLPANPNAQHSSFLKLFRSETPVTSSQPCLESSQRLNSHTSFHCTHPQQTGREKQREKRRRWRRLQTVAKLTPYCGRCLRQACRHLQDGSSRQPTHSTKTCCSTCGNASLQSSDATTACNPLIN